MLVAVLNLVMDSECNSAPRISFSFSSFFLNQNKTKTRRIKSTVAAVSLLFSQSNHLPLLCEDERGAAAHAQQKSASSLAAVGFDCVLASIPRRKREREFPVGSGLQLPSKSEKELMGKALHSSF